VVTARGHVVHASEDEHADLLWALRGGGGNFGVVTSLEFRLHAVGPTVAVAMAFHPVAAANEVLEFYRTVTASAPDELACYALFVNAPPDFPAEHQGKPVLAVVACYSGDVQQGKSLLAPIAEFGQPVMAMVEEMPYTLLQTTFDAGNPSGARYYWKSLLLNELSDPLLQAVVDFAADLHGAYTIIGIEPLGGAQGRVASSATAFPYRDVPFTLGIWTGWAEASEDDANIHWTRAFFDAVQPHGAGAYVNYLSEDEGARIGEAYGDNLERLREAKRTWDPENLFRLNQNIAPAA
jgi:FAD/FMN-containing dehydrogenase